MTVDGAYTDRKAHAPDGSYWLFLDIRHCALWRFDVSYLYGPDGARLKKVVGSNTTLYLGADIERDPAGAFTFYLNPDVNWVGTGLHFLHRDNLTSVRRVTDATARSIAPRPMW